MVLIDKVLTVKTVVPLVGRIVMPHPNFHVLILTSVNILLLHGNRDLAVINIKSWDGDIILDYLFGTNLVTRVLISGK